MYGKYEKRRQNIETPNSGKRTRGGGSDGGVRGDWVTGTEGGT